MKTFVRRYNRCTWMAIVSLVFAVMTIGFIIPGAIGVAGLNRYNDTLLYLALIDSLFAILFLVGWYMCQFEVDDVTTSVHEPQELRKTRQLSYASMRSTYSSASHHLMPLDVSNTVAIEKNA